MYSYCSTMAFAECLEDISQIVFYMPLVVDWTYHLVKILPGEHSPYASLLAILSVKMQEHGVDEQQSLVLGKCVCPSTSQKLLFVNRTYLQSIHTFTAGIKIIHKMHDFYNCLGITSISGQVAIYSYFITSTQPNYRVAVAVWWTNDALLHWVMSFTITGKISTGTTDALHKLR